MKLTTAIQMIVLPALFISSIDMQASDIAPEMTACIKKNAPEKTSVQKIRLRSEGYMGEEKTLSAKVYWKYSSTGTSNLLAVFDEPDDILGSRLLFLEKQSENEIYLYMPALFKVRRIRSDRLSASMYGMDFSYEDFQFLYNMLSTEVAEQRPDVEIDGDPMYSFAVATTSGGDSLYGTIISYVDKQTCVIRKVEFFEPGNRLRKILLVNPDSITDINGKLVPHKFSMRDLKEESETELKVLELQIDPYLDDAIFDPVKLKQHRDIN